MPIIRDDKHCLDYKAMELALGDLLLIIDKFDKLGPNSLTIEFNLPDDTQAELEILQFANRTVSLFDLAELEIDFEEAAQD